MKTLLTNYTFSAASKQVTLTDYPSINLDQILLITNVTRNIIIYNFADPTAGGTLAGNILTLTYNTAAMSNTDRLQIFIEDYIIPSTEASLTAVRVRIDNTNTLLNVLTASVTTFNRQLTSHTQRINGFIIPDYNRIANTYYSTSNNLSLINYKFNSTIVASLSFTYATPASADNALLAEVIKIL